MVGLLPALASFLIRRTLGEPEAFVRQKEAGQPLSFLQRLRLLFKDRATSRASIGIFILCSVQNFGYYGLMIWMPTYLAKTLASLTKSGLWTAVTVVGMTFGIWLFGMLADRFARWKIFVLYQIGAVVMVIGYAQLSDPTLMLFAGAVMGMFVNGMIGGYGALISDTYPVQARATAQNILFNLGRGVGGLGPLVIGALVTQVSFTAAISLLAAIYLLDIYATLFLLPKNRAQAIRWARLVNAEEGLRRTRSGIKQSWGHCVNSAPGSFYSYPATQRAPCSILENFSCGHPDQVVLASSCSIILTRFLSLPDPPTVLCRLSISVLEVSLVSILKHPGHLLTPSFALA